MTLEHSDIMDDFIEGQKIVRASLQASLEQLVAGFALYEGRVGGQGLEDISARQIELLRGAIKEADLLIAHYEMVGSI